MPLGNPFGLIQQPTALAAAGGPIPLLKQAEVFPALW
jgi:hypothetical protein